MISFIVREIMGGHDDVFHNALRRLRSEDLDKELVRLIKKRILMRDDDRTLVPDTLVQFRIAHTFQEKVNIFVRGVFPHPEVIAKRYSVPSSSKRIYFYYVMSPFSLLLKYMHVIWNIPHVKEEIILKRWIRGKD